MSDMLHLFRTSEISCFNTSTRLAEKKLLGRLECVVKRDDEGMIDMLENVPLRLGVLDLIALELQALQTAGFDTARCRELCVREHDFKSRHDS